MISKASVEARVLRFRTDLAAPYRRKQAVSNDGQNPYIPYFGGWASAEPL